MAETPSKRLREDELDDGSSSDSKRQKPYNTILNLLDEEDEEGEPSQEPSHELSGDLSAIFSKLQQELSSSTGCDDSTTTLDLDPLPSAAAEEPELSLAASAEGEEGDGVKSVMRHLLEASDDELGIPNGSGDENNVEKSNSGENFPFGLGESGLWELEDEAANYYTVLQSELFM